MKNLELDGMPSSLQPYIDNVCGIIRKALTESGLQAKIDQPGPALRQMSKDLWYTDINVRLVLNISAKVEPIGLVDINHV
jgi:hypothetical protein